ncbi:MAG: DNA polymerase I [Bdellovibrionales bacterium]
MATKKKLYLVDGSGFIFRAYHALPPLTRADGTPVGAVMGFCNMLAKLEKDLGATHMAVIFDAARKTFRMDIYPEYKAHRPEPPEDLIPQFALVKEAARAFGLPAIEMEGFEADDLLASYALAAKARGEDVVIVSGDKDLMQLMDDGIELFDPMKGKTLALDDVMNKFGVGPEKVVDVQALAGDSADNVPGVPGIGVKTAAELIGIYGDLETLLQRAEEIKQPKRRQTLIDNAELARISKKLVTLKVDVPLPVALEDLNVNKDNTTLAAFLQQQGFKSIITRMGLSGADIPPPASAERAENAKPAAAAAVSVASAMALTGMDAHYECVTTTGQLHKWVEKIRNVQALALDTETDSLTPSTALLVGISLAVAPGDACYIPLNHGIDRDGGLALAERPQQLALKDVISALNPLLTDPAIMKVAHNLKFDLQVLRANGFDVTPHDDTMLLSYVMGAGLHGHGLDELAERYFGHKMIPFSEVCGTGKNMITFDRVPLDKATQYAAEDADFTLRLWLAIKGNMQREGISRIYERMERPLVAVVADMETAGVKIDAAVLAGLSQRFAKQQAELETEIYKLAGQEFNVGSPKQLGDVLFGAMGLPGGTKSKTGAYATGVEILEPLADEYEIAQKVLDWRGVSKLRSTYTEALQEQINPRTGRVHTSFALAITSTGRLSSSDPNLQNIPIRTEDGREIRRAFVAEEGSKLISVDYSQIELRLAASMAGVEALAQAFKDGVDIHALTASQVLGVPLSEVTPAQRRSAKAINFGIIYGISGFGLAKQLGISPGEANAFIGGYLGRFPELRTFMEAQKDKARAKGYVETLYGRRCWVPGIADKNAARRQYAERQAVNAPLQGTAADIMKRAMIALPPALRAVGLKGRMILQVHDELVLEAPADEAEATAALAKKVMESVADPALVAVPLVCEAGIADNWAMAH